MTHIEAMRGWSMSLTWFGVAKLRAAVMAMLKQYDGAGIQLATQCRITSLARLAPKNKLRFSLAILSPIKQARSALAHDLDAMAVIALDEAREMPPGDERTEAIHKAMILRNAVELHELLSGKPDAPAV